jgi:hypothetical protein
MTCKYALYYWFEGDEGGNSADRGSENMTRPQYFDCGSYFSYNFTVVSPNATKPHQMSCDLNADDYGRRCASVQAGFGFIIITL